MDMSPSCALCAGAPQFERKMEGEEITIVLSRAWELRSKITNRIDRATKRGRDDDEAGSTNQSQNHSLGTEGIEADEETESFLSIRDTLESLEEQRASLQALQQQQRYEREVTLAEIDHSRKILVKKIEEYKRQDLEVIHEASAFASETVEHNDNLLLPPYPSHASHRLILDNGCTSSFPSIRSFSRKGIANMDTIENGRKVSDDTKKEATESPVKKSLSGLRHIMNVAAKAALTVVSVMSILTLAGFEPKLGRRSTHFKVMNFFQKQPAEERVPLQCPPGKVLVMVDGEPRCLVKERVEIPFEPVVTAPNVSYGCDEKKTWKTTINQDTARQWRIVNISNQDPSILCWTGWTK